MTVRVSVLVLDCTEDGPKGEGKGDYVTEQFFDPLVLLDTYVSGIVLNAKDTPMKQKATSSWSLHTGSNCPLPIKTSNHSNLQRKYKVRSEPGEG